MAQWWPQDRGGENRGRDPCLVPGLVLSALKPGGLARLGNRILQPTTPKTHWNRLDLAGAERVCSAHCTPRIGIHRQHQNALMVEREQTHLQMHPILPCRDCVLVFHSNTESHSFQRWAVGSGLDSDTRRSQRLDVPPVQPSTVNFENAMKTSHLHKFSVASRLPPNLAISTFALRLKINDR